MSLRTVIAKAILPNIERDLGRALATELQSCGSMVDNMLAPNVFAYSARRSSGAFKASGQVQAPHLYKVDIPVKKEGLF